VRAHAEPALGAPGHDDDAAVQNDDKRADHDVGPRVPKRRYAVACRGDAFDRGVPVALREVEL